MNKRIWAIILALATSALMAIGCGSTASYDESEAVWDSEITESEEVIGPRLDAELLESEEPFFVPKKP